jgi:hypothetical protein
VTLDFDDLHGIQENARYRDALAQLMVAYQANNCAAKPLVTLAYLPGLYYLLHHPYPQDIGVLRPAFDFPEAKLRSILTIRNGWCVLDASEKEIDRNIAVQGQDKREPLRQWLASNSSNRINLLSPSRDLRALHMYVRQPSP